MTIPLERSFAVLRAGGLLVQLNGDSRVPMDSRRMATRIARHFPTVGDVANASHLSLFGRDGGMFEHPRDCKGWEENCPGRPLTYDTRLAQPTISDSIEETLDDELAQNRGSESKDLAALLEAVAHAREFLSRQSQKVYRALIVAHPEFRSLVEQMG